MPSTITPNMNLILPSIGLEPGPQYGSDQNNSFTLIDTHDHTSGKGVPITPQGLNLNSDLDFMQNNATDLRSVRFHPQGSPLSNPSDIGCMYENGVDLYYNDGNGNQIRITQSGSIAGTSGSITGLVSPASASYVVGTQTFVWQQDTNKAANMDMAAAILRDPTTSSNGITLTPPVALAADYTLTLPPAPPGSNSLLVMDPSGNVTVTGTTPDGLTVVNNIVSQNGDVITQTGSVLSELNVIASTGNINATIGNVNAVNINASNLVNPGGASNAGLSSGSANVVQIVSPSSGFSEPIVTGRSYLVPIMLAGQVNSSGSIVLGSDYTAVRNFLGNYTITYNANIFDGTNIPVVVATSSGSGGSPTIAKPLVSQSFIDHAIIIMHDGGGSNVDCGFNFVVYGNRAA